MNIKMKSKLIIYLGIMLAILTACSSEKPTHLEPHLATLPASGITRNEATLHGSVSLEGETTLAYPFLQVWRDGGNGAHFKSYQPFR